MPAGNQGRGRRLAQFIRLGRPVFLSAGFVLHALGVVMALYRGAAFNWTAYLAGQIVVSAVQWMTHYANDYFDLAADRANRCPTRWSGGSRVLVETDMPPRAALATALLLAAVAACGTLFLFVALRPAPLTLAIPLAAMALAWFYSAPPVRLHSRGLGELTTALVVTALTPLLGFYLQAGYLEALPALAAAPLCCFQFAMLLAIEFPDAAADAATGKDTLVVRVGAARAARLYLLAVLAPYALLPLLARAGLPVPVALVLWALAPLAAWQAWRVLRGAWARPAQWSSLAFWGVALVFVAALAELAVFAGLPAP